MSIATWELSFLSLKPRVWVEGDCLYARTSFLRKLITLFSYSREVKVDRSRRLITLRVRSFWFFTREKFIPFDRVAYIDTDFRSMPTSFGWLGATDRWETYVVTLVLRDPQERIPLMSFSGEGSVETGWRGVIFGGDSIIDLAGDQRKAFHRFISLLRDFLGVSIGEPLTISSRFICRNCGRPIPPARKNCLYCGGEKVEKKKR